MRITLHCLGMPFNGETVNERALGGSESAAYYLARELARRGHEVTVFTAIGEDGQGRFDDVTYLSAGTQTEAAPMGDRFEFYAQNTPQDVLLMQRSPVAFAKHYAAKLRFLWVHDLAVVRNRDAFKLNSQSIHGVFCVSDFHRRQIVDTWDLDPRMAARVRVLRNAVDLEVFQDDPQEVEGKDGLAMLYCARPERGLVNLVGEDGIMQRLLDAGSTARLFVCGYQHEVPELEGYYSYLRSRIAALPNVTDLGPLHKPQLAAAWNASDLWIYPTEFEEVSCITAMEAMATGTPAIVSQHGALPETCRDTGTQFIRLKDGKADLDAFVGFVQNVTPKRLAKMRAKQLAARTRHTWEKTAQEFELVVDMALGEAEFSPAAKINHLLRHSDIIAAERLAEETEGLEHRLLDKCRADLGMYEFSRDEAEQRDHYDRFYKERFYQTEWTPGEVERMDGNPRYEEVAEKLKDLPDGATVLDWGCFHGHITLGLAERFPNLRFTGVDIAAEPLEYGRAEAKARELDNVGFLTVDEFRKNNLSGYDAIILGEILEHVRDYRGFMLEMLGYGADTGTLFIVTTPYGPWEWETFERHYPFRFHLHHFERADLEEMFGHLDGFNVVCIPAGYSKRLEPRGWYLTSFVSEASEELCRGIDYDRKLRWTLPQQTISLQVLAKNCAGSILNTLNSAKDYVDEVVIGFDRTSTDRTREIATRHVDDWALHRTHAVHVMEVDSPVETGFDVARNTILAEQSGDWILMLDGDEQLVHGDCIPIHLQPNGWAGYAVPQHHYSVEPLGVISTDYPCRVFRNEDAIRYEGVVHEHPEVGDNEGPGPVKQMLGPHIAHTSYTTEAIRRDKFLRNVRLMARDREKHPHRLLGKALWLRDLALMCRFEGEETGGQITNAMRDRALKGLELWEEIVASDHPMTARLLRDGMEYYDTLSRILGGGFDFAFRCHSSKLNGGAATEHAPEVRASFQTREHLDQLLAVLINEETKSYDSTYF